MFNMTLIKLSPNLQENRESRERAPQGNNHMIQNVGHPIKSWLRLFMFSVNGKKNWELH